MTAPTPNRHSNSREKNLGAILKEITFLSGQLGGLVCAGEKQGRHASFPFEGSPPTEAKNGRLREGEGLDQGGWKYGGLMPSFLI